MWESGASERNDVTLYKTWSFPWRICSVSMTKYAVNCGFGHIYRRNPWWKTSFFSTFILMKFTPLILCQFIVSHGKMLNFHMWFLKSIAFQICETLFFHIKKGFVLDFRKYCRFSYAGTWELVNLFVGTKHFSYHTCYENIGRKQNKILWHPKSRDRQTMDRQNWAIC